jgi:hypothetical protein
MGSRFVWILRLARVSVLIRIAMHDQFLGKRSLLGCLGLLPWWKPLAFRTCYADKNLSQASVPCTITADPSSVVAASLKILGTSGNSSFFIALGFLNWNSSGAVTKYPIDIQLMWIVDDEPKANAIE